ncbi:Uncharacterised protein [Bacteroides pyogenes]|nr:Uncharacterised protein [Bacteroides pyogenes]
MYCILLKTPAYSQISFLPLEFLKLYYNTVHYLKV